METSNTLSLLTADSREFLVMLPYRAGLYVSFSDVTGGWEAQEREIKTLTSILREFSEDYCKCELAQTVLMQTLAERTKWPLWSQQIDALPAEAASTMAVLKDKFSEAQVNSFREVIVDIALAVAMAFREVSEESAAASQQSLLSSVLSHFTGLNRREESPYSRNISSAEKAALVKLCTALGYTKIPTV